jgi:hypothetical protein
MAPHGFVVTDRRCRAATGRMVKQQVPEITPYAIKYGMWEHNWPDTLSILEQDLPQGRTWAGTWFWRSTDST